MHPGYPVIQASEELTGPQGVDPQLEGGGRNPVHAVLEIDNLNIMLRDDDAVRGSHAFGDISPQVHDLLHEDLRLGTAGLPPLQLFQNEGGIAPAGFLHLFGVVVHTGPGILIRNAQQLMEQVFAQAVGLRALRGEDGALVRELLAEPGGTGAVVPALRGGGRQKRVLIRQTYHPALQPPPAAPRTFPAEHLPGTAPRRIR